MNMETIKACVSALGVLIVAGAGLFGFDLDAGMVQNGLSVLAFIAAFAWGIWKNHNFTEAAQDAQAYLDMLKAAPVDDEWDEVQ
jgi:hypothetical protein